MFIISGIIFINKFKTPLYQLKQEKVAIFLFSEALLVLTDNTDVPISECSEDSCQSKEVIFQAEII